MGLQQQKIHSLSSCFVKKQPAQQTKSVRWQSSKCVELNTDGDQLMYV
jgi:hypothetical protein